MDTVSITAKKDFLLSDIKKLLATHFQIEDTASGGICIHGSNSRVYIYLNTAQQIFLDYSDVTLVKNVLSVLGNADDLTIDNDFGTVLPGNEFVSRIKSDKNWNWRN